MIRFILIVLFVVLFLLFSYILFFVEWIVGKFNKKSRDYSSLRIVQWAFRVVLFLSGVKVTVRGKENILEEPALYVANHRGFFDIVIMYTHCKNLTGFVAKDAVEKVPTLRDWMRYLYCIFLDRKDPRSGMQMILQAIEQIKNGISVCIFPEGTRNKGEELSLLPFKEGSFKIAIKSGCPIVPVSLNNTVEVFEAHLPRIKRTHVVVEYGTPIYPNELSKEEQKVIGATCQKVIETTLKENVTLVG